MIIRRTEWGARSPKSISHNITPQNGGVALHYEGPHLGTFPHIECFKKLRTIQRYHMDSKGWADIAYTYVVCPHGKIFECRGPNVRTAAQGTNSGNDNYYAVCVLMGQGDTLTNAAKDGVLEAIAYLRRYGRAGSSVKAHKDFHATGCPGDAITTWLRGGLKDPTPGAVRPSPAPAPVRPKYPEPKRLLFWDKRKGKMLHGDDVKWVQDKLNRFFKKKVVKVDGWFGKGTFDWTKEYQSEVFRSRKERDGIVGKNTREKLRRIP